MVRTKRSWRMKVYFVYFVPATVELNARTASMRIAGTGHDEPVSEAGRAEQGCDRYTTGGDHLQHDE